MLKHTTLGDVRPSKKPLLHVHTSRPDQRSPWCPDCNKALESAIRLQDAMTELHRFMREVRHA